MAMTPEQIAAMNAQNAAAIAKPARTHEQRVEARLTAIAVFTGVIAVVSLIGLFAPIALLGMFR